MPEVFISKQKSSKKRSKPKFVYVFAILLLILFGLLVAWSRSTGKPQTAASSDAAAKSSDTSSTENSKQTTGAVKIFSGEQFQQLYESFAYPNTQELQRPITITGNVSADAKIESLAVARGYKLRPVAVTGLVKVGNESLQPLAAEAWQKLIDAAKADGVSISLTSGFRSPSDQRELFVSRLYAKGVSAADVSAGKADQAVNSTLSTTAIPGYSKHHSGFTVDIGCVNEPNKSFEASVCFTWLNENNYLNAKKAGWIPSYPKEAVNQGPAPEAWEYVWVGTSPLFD